MSERTLCLQALRSAVRIIKQWHDLGGQAAPPQVVERAWEIYYQNSPEMSQIRRAIKILEDAEG